MATDPSEVRLNAQDDKSTLSARELGAMALTVPDAFFDPLPDDELGAWEPS